MKLLKRIYRGIRTRLGFPSPIVDAELLGQKLKVHLGTIRQTSDYDDAWLFACAQDAKIIMDIGANIGQSTLLVLQSDAVEEVILVEANPKALSLAAENLILNQLIQRVRFVCAFVSNTVGDVLTFWTVGVGAAGSAYESHAVTAAKRHKSITVPTITLDAMCESFRIVPDLVKIDVEGAEYLVLQGSTDLAKHQKTRFFIEMHSNAEMTMLMNANNVLQWCKENQYKAWYLAGKVELTQAEQIQTRGRCHLLLQASEREAPSDLLAIEQGAPLERVQRKKAY